MAPLLHHLTPPSKALRVLRAKLAEAQAAKAAAAAQAVRQAAIGRGGFNERIRTYNYPEGRVTDHRWVQGLWQGLGGALIRPS